jgi:hypothetical protein
MAYFLGALVKIYPYRSTSNSFKKNIFYIQFCAPSLPTRYTQSPQVCSSGLNCSLQINSKQLSNEPDVRRHYFTITDVSIHFALTNDVSNISIRIINIKSWIIIIIIIIIITFFMQGIYNYIRTKPCFTVCSVTTIQWLTCTLCNATSYDFYCNGSVSRSITVQCSESPCFSGMFCRHFLHDSDAFQLHVLLFGTTSVFTFHIRCISIITY